MRSTQFYRACSDRRRSLGFTLIELMITVAVVAILAAVAVPTYQDQVRKSRRAQAKADLVEYSQMAERFHTVQNTYQGFALPSTRSPREGATAWYTLGIQQAAVPSPSRPRRRARRPRTSAARCPSTRRV